MARWILVVAVLAIVSSGCEGGLPLMAQANPQTKVGISPISKDIMIFSNDGKTFEAEGVKFASGKDGTTFEAAKIAVSDRSVENRTANVEQIKAGAEQIKALGETVLGCAVEIRKILNPASGIVDSLGEAAPKLAAIADALESVAAQAEATTQPASHEE